MALMVLQYIPDEDDPWSIVRHLLGAVPAGSGRTGPVRGQADGLGFLVCDRDAKYTAAFDAMFTAGSCACIASMADRADSVLPPSGDNHKNMHRGTGGKEFLQNVTATPGN
jgi:hypothetical protein